MSQTKQIHSLYITNRSGGLMATMYFRNFSRVQSENLRMTIISTLHSLSLMSRQVAIDPHKSQYIENIVIEGTVISIHQTPTGVSFILVAEGMTEIPQRDAIMSEIHSLYVDYVMKNPAYLDEQPFEGNSKEFFTRVEKLIEAKNNSL